MIGIEGQRLGITGREKTMRSLFTQILVKEKPNSNCFKIQHKWLKDYVKYNILMYPLHDALHPSSNSS